jgi:ABC-type hemin transport system ATPase subunit
LFADCIIVLDRGLIDCNGHPQDALTEGIIAGVFTIETNVRRPPESRLPFVLPQAMASRLPRLAAS